MEPFLQTIRGTGVYVLIGSDWCSECGKLKAELAKQEFAHINVDVDNDPDEADHCAVRKLPTLQYWADGEKVEEAVGTKAIRDVVQHKLHPVRVAETETPQSQLDAFFDSMPDF
tara:strand:+ start:43 stop:384 length:342 start_codon:yes stop_codon:yes gene_type:complete